MDPHEMEPIVLALPASWQPWARLLVEASVLASLLAAALKAVGVRNWLTVLLDAIAANTTPVKSRRAAQLEGQVAGLTGEVAQLSAEKARATARTIPPLPIMCLALVALGGCSWRERARTTLTDHVWPTLVECGPPVDALLKAARDALGADGPLTDEMREAVVGLAREHGPGAVACTLGRLATQGTDALARKSAVATNPYDAAAAQHAARLLEELDVTVLVGE